mmetsp:Transcript_68042/g.197147  ORF Transcript_68042/g.197147 Transcript_68042/m.197147 type:complete len:202 (-) Transcript_68042:12-617(-)
MGGGGGGVVEVLPASVGATARRSTPGGLREPASPQGTRCSQAAAPHRDASRAPPPPPPAQERATLEAAGGLPSGYAEGENVSGCTCCSASSPELDSRSKPGCRKRHLRPLSQLPACHCRHTAADACGASRGPGRWRTPSTAGWRNRHRPPWEQPPADQCTQTAAAWPWPAPPKIVTRSSDAAAAVIEARGGVGFRTAVATA